MIQDVIIYQRDQLNEEIIKIIIMIKFNLLQHQKLRQDYSAVISQNIMKDLFLNEADTDTENSFYIFISDDDDTEENM